MAILVHLLQVGPLFLPNKLAPDFSRINPFKGVQRLVSISNFVRLGFGLFKISVVVAVAAWCLLDFQGVILSMGTREIGEIGSILFEILLGTCLKIGIALLDTRHPRLRLPEVEIRAGLEDDHARSA